MYLKILFNGILIFLLFAIQVAFIPILPGWLGSLNLVLVVLVFILMFGSFNLAMPWALALGFLYDTVSFSIFGLHLLSIGLAVLATNFLLNNFLTNRSLYSVAALTTFITFIYSIFIFLGGFLDGLLKQQTDFGLSKYYLMGIFEQLILNLIVTVIIFYSLNYLGRRFKPVFLSRRLRKF